MRSPRLADCAFGFGAFASGAMAVADYSTLHPLNPPRHPVFRTVILHFSFHICAAILAIRLSTPSSAPYSCTSRFTPALSSMQSILYSAPYSCVMCFFFRPSAGRDAARCRPCPPTPAFVAPRSPVRGGFCPGGPAGLWPGRRFSARSRASQAPRNPPGAS